MMTSLVLGAIFLVLALPHSADAQVFVRGAEEGAAKGQFLGRPRFGTYVRDRGLVSYDYDEDVRLGAVLPRGGVGLHDVFDVYDPRGYRYGVVNDRILIVHPQTGRIVDVID